MMVLMRVKHQKQPITMTDVKVWLTAWLACAVQWGDMFLSVSGHEDKLSFSKVVFATAAAKLSA